MTPFIDVVRLYRTRMVVEVKDAKVAKEMLDSKASPSWGNGPIPDTDWTQLACASPGRIGEHGTVFVCQNALLGVK
jgi:hypothetical protein